MTSENNEQKQAAENNEDLDFDRTNTSTTDTQPITDNELGSEEDAVDQTKLEELAANEVTPLSEGEKKPKLQDNDRIDELNKKTSIGD